MNEPAFSDRAQWITAAGAAGRKNCFVRFYRALELAEVPEELTLKITAESYYGLWINGLFVRRGPVRGTAFLHSFDLFDAAPYLHGGVNHLAVLAHSPGEENFVAAPGCDAPALLLELGDVLTSDAAFRALIAPDYHPTGEYFARQTGFMEDRDLALAPDDRRWTVGLDGAAQWPAAVPAKVLRHKKLVARDVPELAERVIFPVSTVRTAEVTRTPAPQKKFYQELDGEPWSASAAARIAGVATLCGPDASCVIAPDASGRGAALIADLGQDFTGYPEVEIECAEAGTLLALTFGEALIEDDRIRLDFKNPLYGFTDRYRLAAGRNRVGSLLTERGGRYLQLVFHDLTAPVAIRRLAFREHRYPCTDRGAFHCSDALLDRIWAMCAETLKVCTTDVFTDCPWRERSFWVNDLVVENRTSLAAFGASALHKRAFRLAFSQQREDGWIPGVCPAPQVTTLKWVLPATDLFLFLMLHDYHLASGDLETPKTYLPQLEKILRAAETGRDADGMVFAPREAWHFYDWGFEFRDQCFRRQKESMFNFLYARALEIFMELAALTGYRCDRAELAAKRKAALKGVWKRFLDPATGLLADDYTYYHFHENAPDTVGKVSNQLSHALALLYSEVPAANREKFIKALEDETVLMPDLYLQSFVLRAMHKAGRDAAALERIRKYWGRIVADGGRTVYENGIAKFGHELQECGHTGSLCHGFGTAPLEFLQTSVLGVEPLAPGFARFALDPRPADLEFAAGRVPTPHGEIAVAWRRTGGRLAAELTVPEGCVAVLTDGRELGAGRHEVNLTIEDSARKGLRK